MQKSDQAIVRMTPEHKQKLKEAAEAMDASISELMMQGTNLMVLHYYKNIADGLEALHEENRSDEEHDKIDRGVKEYRAKANYFSRRIDAIQAQAQMYKDIEEVGVFTMVNA